jgi:uncharacterized protein
VPLDQGLTVARRANLSLAKLSFRGKGAHTMTRTPSERTTVKRKPQRGAYDRETIDQILDEGLICHVGFSIEGQTIVLPTIHVRVGDYVYLHGSPASRLLQALAGGAEACVTVTLVDGLVLARSAMHHSMNYRSVVLFGTATLVEKATEKMAVFEALVEHVIPGRWAETRWPTDDEIRRTMVVSIPIHEASAKVRTGPPLDDEADYELSHWAGVLPLRLAADHPIADPGLRAGIEPPAHVTSYIGRRAQRQDEQEHIGIATSESSNAIIRRYYHALWNAWNVALADELISIDVSFLGSLGVRVQGRASFVDYVHFVRRAFPDFHNTIEEMIAEGDKVAVRLTYSGTHRGELFGIEATGRSFTYSGAAIFRIADGKIAEGWVLGDTRGLMEQLRGGKDRP